MIPQIVQLESKKGADCQFLESLKKNITHFIHTLFVLYSFLMWFLDFTNME